LKLKEKSAYLAKFFLSSVQRSFSRPEKPSFLIVGAQKSGSSSLHYYLNQHPKIKGSFPKEIHYFNREINFGKSTKWYESHFYGKDKVGFEATPSYLFNPECPRLIHEYNPNLKFIIVLRNPISRALSAYNMYRDFYRRRAFRLVKTQNKPGVVNPIYKFLFEGRSEFPSIEEVFELEIQDYENGLFREPAIFRRGVYAPQIENYYKYFTPEQFLIFGFEDLTKNLEESLNKIYSFIDVKPFPFEEIDSKPINRRNYKNELNSSFVKELEQFYSVPNRELEQLLGKKINW
jgi:hypothetical protein